MQIRVYVGGDAQALRSLFFNTVRQINVTHYNQSQLAAWAPESYDLAAPISHLSQNLTVLLLVMQICKLAV